MHAKDFIFPGVILVLVLVVGIGLVLTHADKPALVENIATPSATTTESAEAPQEAPPRTPATSGGQGTHPYGSTTLALGEAAVFPDGLSIRPMHVLEDSRCPADVMCIQAGTVKLEIAVQSGGDPGTRTLTIGQKVTIGGDTMTFVSVAPDKKHAGYPAPSEYRFTISVTHG